MPLSYDAPARLLTISTDNSTYQMKVDEYGYLLHLYYGARAEGDLSYLLTYCDRSGMCGCPHDVADRTYSLDFLPQEYPFQGSGDMRSPMLLVRDAEGTFGGDLRYKCHEIRPGKYDLPGLPAVYAGEKDDAETLSVTLADERLGLEVELLYGRGREGRRRDPLGDARRRAPGPRGRAALRRPAQAGHHHPRRDCP